MIKLSPSAQYVLQSLIPYSDANLRLAYSPSSFFYELERKSKINERTLRSAYYRAIRHELITVDEYGKPHLTAKGKLETERYKPKTLGKDAHLLVIFDIPENERTKRTHLRILLRELGFRQIQKSVWASPIDHRQYLKAEIKEYGLEDCVIIYEAVMLKI